MTARLLAPGVSGASVPPPSRTGSGLLAAALLAATLGAWFVESRSALAGRVRTLQPFAVWTAVPTPERSVPLLFLSLHQPGKGRLDLIHVPEDYRLGPKETVGTAFQRLARNLDSAGASREVCRRLQALLFSRPTLGWLDLGQPRFLAEEPGSFPAGDPAAVMKRRLASRSSGAAFWRRLPGLLRKPGVDVLLSPGASGAQAPGADILPPWLLQGADRLAYGLELHRLGRGAVCPAWLPEDPSLEPFLLRILGAGSEPPRPADRPVTVEVLNATVLKGIATDATKVIRLRGADVLHFGNAESEHPGTLVYDRTGRLEDALSVRDMTGCPSAEAVTRIRERTLVEVSVIVGEDCAGVGAGQPIARASER
ncbi:MAG: LytR C-terminal domain-containing protein [Elusimicrobiota bacterium]